jgi:hypothetical protein
MISSRVPSSRLPVGSSASRTAGVLTRALAMATLPPLTIADPERDQGCLDILLRRRASGRRAAPARPHSQGSGGAGQGRAAGRRDDQPPASRR